MNCRHLLSALFLLPLLLSAPGCSSLPRDVAGRREVYQQRLDRLQFPLTRQHLYRALHPASPPRPLEKFSLLSARESYRVDADFVVEMTVLYEAVVGPTSLLNPADSLGRQIRSLVNTSRSIGVMLNTGTPNHPDDIVQSARLVLQPVRDY